MTIELLTEHHLEFLSLKEGCTDSSESTLVKIPYCWKSHDEAQYYIISSSSWLGVRMSLMAGLITGLTAVFGVMGRDSISAAMVGLSISYSMQVYIFLGFFFLIICLFSVYTR